MRIQSYCKRQVAPWSGGSVAVHPDTTEICFVTHGLQHLRIDQAALELTPGEVAVVPPQVEHVAWSEAEGYHEVVLHIPPQPLEAGLYRSDAALLGRLADEASLSTLRAVLAGLGPRRSTASDPQIARVLARLHRNLARDWSLAALAELAGWSPGHFSRRFRRELGTSPMRWLRKQRVARAAWLLRTTDHPVTRIAHEVGFSTPSRLSEAFLAEHGVSPSQWRDQAL